MDLVWKVTARDAQEIRRFVRERRREPLVQRRIRTNLRGYHRAPRIENFWRGILLALLTTQQRSGPDSAVAEFFRRSPFPLTYQRCANARSPKTMLRRTLKAQRGIRMNERIADQASSNLRLLHGGHWYETREELQRLERHRGRGTEREVAAYLATTYIGLGPKQSRNLLQWMGLTRYEIPLDSRITKWLNGFGFPIRLTAQALSDPNYYDTVSDGVQALCKKAGVFPCVLDAAVFSSFDEAEWSSGSRGW